MADTDNYGFGRYAAPEELVTPATVTPGTLASGLVPARSTTDKKQDKQNARDIINMALVGGIADPAAGQLIKIIDKAFPALDLMTEFEEMQTEEAIPGVLSEIDRAEIERSRAIGEAIVPRSKAKGRVLTPRGKIAKAALSTAPGYAAKTPTGAKAFADVKSAVATAEGAVSAAQAKARGDADKQRATITAAQLKEQKNVNFNGAIWRNDRLEAFVRKGTTIGNRRWIMSQGDKDIDIDAKGDPVKEGKWYQNSEISLRAGDLGTPQPWVYYNQSDEGPKFANAMELEEVDDQGRRRKQVMLSIPGHEKANREGLTRVEDAGGFWMREPAAGLFEPRQWPDQENQTAIDYWEERNMQGMIIQRAMLTAEPLLAMATEGTSDYNPDAFTTVGGLTAALKSIDRNMESVNRLLGGSRGATRFWQRTFSGRGKDPETGYDREGFAAANMKAALDEYRRVLSGGVGDEATARRRFLVAARELEFSANDQKGLGGKFNWNLEEISDVSQDRAMRMAIQLELAYMAAAAAGQTGKTLSDRDVANFLQQVGFDNEKAEEVGLLVTRFIYNRFIEFDHTDIMLRGLMEFPEDKLDPYLKGTIGLSDAELKDPEAGLVKMNRTAGGFMAGFVEWDTERENKDGTKGGWRIRPFHELAKTLRASEPYVEKGGYFDIYGFPNYKERLRGRAQEPVKEHQGIKNIRYRLR